MTNTPVFTQTPKIGLVTCVNADGTTAKTVYTAGSNGSKIVALTATSTEVNPNNRTFTVSITRSATAYTLVTVTIPFGSGTDGSTAAVDLLNSTILPSLPLDNDGQKYLFLQSGDTLTVALTTSAVTAGKTVTFAAIAADF